MDNKKIELSLIKYIMVFQFKIQIEQITNPPVWRRIKVGSDTNFSEFHEIIQVVFGWSFSHLYQFSEKGFASHFQIQDLEMADEEFGEVGDADKIRLRDIFEKEKQTYRYIYDFGDDWNHKITLEKILKENIDYPICVAGKGKCPPEDCGGVWGFAEFKEAVNDPRHPEYEEFREWLGLEDNEIWDFEEFDLEEVNDELRGLS